jgi:exosome complex component RRP41
MATFSVFERKRPAPGRREKEVSMVITDCLKPVLFLELYPGTSFEVYINVLDADGGTRCACTTVAALALADAGIPMRSLVTAVAIGKIDGELITDLSGIEDKAGEADLPCAMTWFNEELSLLQFDGNMDTEEFSQSLTLAKEAISKIYEIQLDALKKKYVEIQEKYSGGEK